MQNKEAIDLPRLEEEYLTDRSFPWKLRPCYALPADASVEDMRAMAIQAMKDSVSVPWQTDQPIRYTKALGGAGSYDLEPGIAFSGLPYTASASGIFSWLEYVDPESGHIQNAPFDRLGFELGNACAPAVSWAQNAVCPSVAMGLVCRWYLPVNGYEPVGSLKIPEGVKDYVDYPTRIVQQDAGKEAVLEAYTLALPADTLIKAGWLPGQHTMMVGELPTVVRDENGEIDLDKSFIRVVDQRSKEYPVEQDGREMSRRGRILAEVPFRLLYEEGYIVVRPRAWIEGAPYEPAWVKMIPAVWDPDDVLHARFRSNYRIAVIRTELISPEGEVITARLNLPTGQLSQRYWQQGFDGQDIPEYEAFIKARAEHPEAHVKITVRVATGEAFVCEEKK